MCGIYGYLDRHGRSLGDAALQSMAQSIEHRGPDGHGSYRAPGVAIGNQRLAILDPESGQQPFFSFDRRIAVVQNGEIFNFVELAAELKSRGIPCQTRCDTEVILRLYETYGIDFVSKLNGMFAIAIYDTREQALYLIRDRVGEKPLYVYDDDERVLFGSEIKSLLAAGAPADTDPQALDEFLTFNFIPPPRTIYRGISHVMPGQWMKITRSGTETRCWWDLAQITAEQRSEQEWIEEFNATLSDAVRLRLRADVPFGAFLSGGVDSSTVVGLMSAQLAQPVKTFCIGFHEQRFDESGYAAEAARRFGTEHYMQRVDANMLDSWSRAIWHCDQPHGDISFLPTLRVSELAVGHVKMVLTGDGADELFAGYDKYKEFFSDSSVFTCGEDQFRERYFNNLCLFRDAERERVCGEWNPRSFTGFEVVNRLLDAVPHMDRVNQALYLDMMLLLPGNNLVKPDRMSMAVGLETRAPFLDYRMMELAFRMPGSLKLSGGETKRIYKRAVTPMIGAELAYRRKQMFTVPVGQWLKTGLNEYSHNMLLSPRVEHRGLFAMAEVERMLSMHQSGKCDYTRQLRALIAVEHWSRMFSDVRSSIPQPMRAA